MNKTKDEFIAHLESLSHDWQKECDNTVAAQRLAHRIVRAFESYLGVGHPRALQVQELIEEADPSTNYFQCSEQTQKRLDRRRNQVRSYLEALLEDMRDGWDVDYAAARRIETYEDLLDLALSITSGERPDPWAGAVIAGAVLERHLSKLCEARGIGGVSGISRRNNGLRATGLYGKAQSAQIEMWAHLRNAATHADFQEFERDRDKVPSMIADLKVFLETYPS